MAYEVLKGRDPGPQLVARAWSLKTAKTWKPIMYAQSRQHEIPTEPKRGAETYNRAERGQNRKSPM